MKKDKKFSFLIHGNPHTVMFTRSGAKFELYIDGDLAAQINKSSYEEDVEKDVIIDGKVCQFVVYGNDPDLVMDGIMMGVDFQERKTRRFHKRVLLGLGILQVLIGTFCFLGWFIMNAAQVYVIGGLLMPLSAALFTLAGVVEIIFGLRIQVE